MIIVLAALVALTAPAGASNHSRAADPSASAVVSGSLATLQPAVLPVDAPARGAVTAAWPHAAPAADHAMMASASTGGGLRPQRGKPCGYLPAARPDHRTAGDPRAPPAAPRPS